MVDQAPIEPVYSKNSQSILTAERRRLGLEDRPIVGLSLSGGGIRSASFALGVLQALYGFGVFDRFHYLSTVSGGGYIGSALTYFRNVFREFGPDWFPFGYLRPRGGASDVRAMGARTPSEIPTRGPKVEGTGTTEAKPDAVLNEDRGNELARRIVSFLRQHASFLTPSRPLNTAALGAGVVRGLVSTALPYFAILAGLLGLLIAIGFFDKEPAYDLMIRAAAPDAVMQVSPPGCDPCEIPGPPAPAVYLAAWPANIGLAVIALTLAVYFLSSVMAGLTTYLDKNEKHGDRGYRWLILLYSRSGRLLVLAAAILLLATLPWLHTYLHFLFDQGDTQLPANFAALGAALLGGLGLIGKLRGILGGKTSKPSTLRAFGMSVAGILFVYGIFLLAYGVAEDWLGALQSFRLPAIAFGVGLATAFIININRATQHRIYRDRLMEVFCAEQDALENCRWMPAARANSADGYLRNMMNPQAPYHLINTCLVTTDSNDRRFRGRGGDNFILSPLYCGSDATGWAATDAAMGNLSIATAAAVSGAALNAHTGPHGSGLLRNKAYSAVLSFLGLNLGYWARNPRKYHGHQRGDAPRFYMPNLLKPGIASLTGRHLNERGGYVQLSDGGHFENLAIYELIRRKVAFLWVSDAGQDVGFSFEDMSNAVERVRVDFGVNIRFRDPGYDLTHLIPGSIASDDPAEQNFFERYNLARRGYAIGTIEYPDEPEPGIIVYVKSTLTRGLPGDLYGYKARNADFPHQTTLDQFFDEEQFEAYRELGYRLASELFRDIKTIREANEAMPPALDAVAWRLDL